MMGKVNKVPTRLQMEAAECGAASLAMILQYYGRHIALEDLRDDCEISRDGSTVYALTKAAKLHGLTAKGTFRSIERLKNETNYPAIILWMNCHFMVLEGYKRGYFYINDPAIGRRKISEVDFKKDYSNLTVILEKSDSFQPKKSENNLFGILKEMLGKNTNAVSLLFFFSLLLIIPGLCIPVFSQIFINQYFIQGSEGILYPLIGVMAFIFFLQLGLVSIQQGLLIRLSQKLSIVLSSRFVERLFHLSDQFYKQRFAGDLIARLESNNQLAGLLSGQLASAVVNLIQVLFYVVVMLLYNWQLSLLVFCSVGVSIAVYQASKIIIQESNIAIQQQSGKQLSSIIGGVNMIETLKSTSSESDFFSRWSGLNAELTNSEQSLMQKSLWINTIPAFASSAFSAIVLGLGAWFVLEGAFNIGELVAFQALSIAFTTPLLSIISFGNQLQAIVAIINRIMDVLRYKTDNKQLDIQLDSTAKLTGRIQLKDITFGYDKSQAPLVKSLNLDIYPGQKIALIGPSGSGKSTIANLIIGLNQSWEGDVYFDGIALKELSKLQFKQSIAVVSQNIMLFEGTVGENVTLWGKNPLNDIEQALKDACIYEDIAIRSGYLDGHVAQAGGNFSGGQKQRLEIARALATNPSIMILDEATSALDTITKKKVIDNITRRGCTCVVIAHRLSAIRDCDEIIVLQAGDILERGTHNELFALGGVYTKMMGTEE